jgi:hypothetical protein
MYIVKFDDSGTLQWSRTIGRTRFDFGRSIIQTADGGYVLSGYTSSLGAGNNDMYVVKLDGSGNTCGNITSPLSIPGTGGTMGTPMPIFAFPTQP